MKIKSFPPFFFLLMIYLLTGFGLKAQEIQLIYSGNNETIIKAVKAANAILKNDKFYHQVDSVTSFGFTSFTGKMIANEFKKFKGNVLVKEYWNPLSSANASTQHVIKINTAKLKRSHCSIVNTLIHETVHAVDWHTNGDWDYTHDGNSPDGQEFTAPWVIGAIAEKLCP